MDANERKRLRRYFQRLPEWPFVLGSVGILLLIAGPAWEGRLLGAAGLAVAGWCSVRFLRDSPSDAAFDALIAEDLAQLEARAHDRCDLPEQIRPPVVITGPRFRHLGGAQFGFQRGADGIARFTPLDVTMIHFTEHQLITYQCALDLFTGKPLNERCDEFFYTDVVNVSLRSDAFTYDLADLDAKILARAPRVAESAVNGKVQVASAEFFRLVTAGGTSIEVMLSDPSLIEQLGGGRVDAVRAANAVQAVRLMLRDKKAGALPLRHPAERWTR
jgi:hypothetical protein